MKTFSFFAHLSSFLFVFISGWILWYQPDFDSVNIPWRITGITIAIYLFFQGILAMVTRGQGVGAGLIDMGLSAAILCWLVVIVMTADKSEIVLWWEFYLWFLVPALYDFFVNNGILFKIFGLSSAVTRE